MSEGEGSGRAKRDVWVQWASGIVLLVLIVLVVGIELLFSSAQEAQGTGPGHPQGQAEGTGGGHPQGQAEGRQIRDIPIEDLFRLGGGTEGAARTTTSGRVSGTVSQPMEQGGLTADGLTADGLPADGLTADGLTADGLTADGLTADGLTADGLTGNNTLDAAQVDVEAGRAPPSAIEGQPAPMPVGDAPPSAIVGEPDPVPVGRHPDDAAEDNPQKPPPQDDSHGPGDGAGEQSWLSRLLGIKPSSDPEGGTGGLDLDDLVGVRREHEVVEHEEVTDLSLRVSQPKIGEAPPKAEIEYSELSGNPPPVEFAGVGPGNNFVRQYSADKVVRLVGDLETNPAYGYFFVGVFEAAISQSEPPQSTGGLQTGTLAAPGRFSIPVPRGAGMVYLYVIPALKPGDPADFSKLVACPDNPVSVGDRDVTGLRLVIP